MRFGIVICSALTALGFSAANADQLDSRLAPLFDELKTAAPLDAPAVRRRIVEVWADAPSDTVDVLIDRAEILIADGDDGAAHVLLDVIVALAPNFAHGYALRGGLHLAADDMEAACADLERAIALEPRHFQARLALSSILAGAGETSAAYDMLRATLLLDPQNAVALERLERLQPDIDSQEI